jgi:predicted transcriptional regulator
VDQLPDECTWGEVMNLIYVRQKIESGLANESAGRTVPHDEVFKKYQNDAS